MDLKMNLDGLKQIIESARAHTQSKTNIDISGVSNWNWAQFSVHFIVSVGCGIAWNAYRSYLNILGVK